MSLAGNCKTHVFLREAVLRRENTMKTSERKIYVYAGWEPLKDPVPIGRLFAIPSKNRELLSFEYEDTWLSSSEGRSLDPDLHLFRGRQYPRKEIPSFNLFMDSSPDRWGRTLMRRREALTARREGRPERFLEESDFLLGVHDRARMGALRFKTRESGPFLAEDTALSTPPWTRLRELEEAARRFGETENSLEEEGWLKILFAPGSSLGGARPKATAADPEGRLWIAKFPSHRDTEDTGAWEKCVHDLAAKAGLVVSESRLDQFSSQGSTFMARRFDRTEENTRIHFASAMPLLGKIWRSSGNALYSASRYRIPTTTSGTTAFCSMPQAGAFLPCTMSILIRTAGASA